MARLLPFADKRRRLKTIHDRHIHIENDESEVVVQKRTQRIDSRSDADQVLAQIRQECFKSNEIFYVIINQQNADLVFGHTSVLWPAHKAVRKGAICSSGRILSTATEAIAASGMMWPSAAAGSCTTA